MRSIRNLKNLKGKVVLLRVDFNVPIKDGKVADDFRIRKAIPTIKYLHDRGAKIIILAHLGKDGSESLSPVVKSFFRISRLSKDDVFFFNNIRQFKGEMNNDARFAKKLAELGDIYVNDAFSVSHRPHASVVAVAKYLPSYAGFQLEEEVKNLSKALVKPRRPFLFILGGAKFSTKMPLIKKYLKLADYVFIGGALASDFLKARGYEVGKSLVDGKSDGIATLLRNKKLILPTDVVVRSSKKLKNKKVEEVGKNDSIIDVGEESLEKLAELAVDAKMVLWNGPLGKYEDGGDVSTKKLLQVVSRTRGESIIGGGDTVAVLSEMKLEKKFTFVSTGGGATLDFLAKGTLPGIKALD
ncbi:MAG TPA: phosphoglycerate kinase [Candidatus Paceibacterota bacterium]|nr:phosphoglycerate kinase [Candidatus Paceibacterota bacterium]